MDDVRRAEGHVHVDRSVVEVEPDAGGDDLPEAGDVVALERGEDIAPGDRDRLFAPRVERDRDDARVLQARRLRALRVEDLRPPAQEREEREGRRRGEERGVVEERAPGGGAVGGEELGGGGPDPEDERPFAVPLALDDEAVDAHRREAADPELSPRVAGEVRGGGVRADQLDRDRAAVPRLRRGRCGDRHVDLPGRAPSFARCLDRRGEALVRRARPAERRARARV